MSDKPHLPSYVQRVLEAEADSEHSLPGRLRTFVKALAEVVDWGSGIGAASIAQLSFKTGYAKSTINRWRGELRDHPVWGGDEGLLVVRNRNYRAVRQPEDREDRRNVWNLSRIFPVAAALGGRLARPAPAPSTPLEARPAVVIEPGEPPPPRPPRERRSSRIPFGEPRGASVALDPALAWVHEKLANFQDQLGVEGVKREQLGMILKGGRAKGRTDDQIAEAIAEGAAKCLELGLRGDSALAYVIKCVLMPPLRRRAALPPEPAARAPRSPSALAPAAGPPASAPPGVSGRIDRSAAAAVLAAARAPPPVGRTVPPDTA